MRFNGGKNMNYKDPQVLGGLAAILVGLLVYFYPVLSMLDVAGLPTATIVLVVAGLVLIYMKMKN
jgi:hypothetical protein